MAKEISFKAGSKNRHDSLYKARFMHESEQEPKNVADEIRKHIDWLEGLLEKESVHKGFTIHDFTEQSVRESKPLVIAALTAVDRLYAASLMYSHLDTNDNSNPIHMRLIRDLVLSIESMLFVQEALHETAILDLKKRSKPIREKAQESQSIKRAQIELCQPEYKRITELRPNFSKSDVARHLKAWLWENHRISKAERTIRSWIKEM